MKKKRLIWHIYPSYVLLLALALIAVAISASRIAHTFHYDQTEHELTNAAFLIAEQLKTRPDLDKTSEIDILCQSLARKTGYRVTVILPSGVVAGDSEKDPATMNNHSRREEVLQRVRRAIGGRQEDALVDRPEMHHRRAKRIGRRRRAVRHGY